MISVIFLGLVCLVLLFLVPSKKRGLTYSFILITLFLCIRYRWGNDYSSYLGLFQEFNSYGFALFDISRSAELYRVHNEFGWVILNRLFGIIGAGFFGLVIFLSIFENVIIFKMIEKYVDPQNYWIAIVFYVFTSSFCIHASMMRQYLCICLYMVVVDLMCQKKVRGYVFWSLGIIILGSFFHRSFLVMSLSLPLFYVYIRQQRTIIFLSIILATIYILWSKFGHRIFESTLINFLDNNDSFSDYSRFVGEQHDSALINSGIGVIFKYIMFFVWLFILPQVEKEKQPLIILGIASYFFNVITDVVYMAGRLTDYLYVVDLFRWAILFSLAKRRPVLFALFALGVLSTILEFSRFYTSPTWYEHCFHYHTIFEAGQWL